MILLDANILIRAVLGRRVRNLLDEYSSRGVRFFAPEVAFQDAEKYLPSLLEKRGKPASDVLPALEYLSQIVEIADRDLYASFEEDARERLRGRDEHDWPVLASALALSCPIWSEDADFFGTGVAIWTTNRIEIFLEGQLKSSAEKEQEEETCPPTGNPSWEWMRLALLATTDISTNKSSSLISARLSSVHFLLVLGLQLL